MTTNALTTTLLSLAKTIDHSLLHPTLTDASLQQGLALCKKYSVASACVKPYHVQSAKAALTNTSVLVCAVIAFPHGNGITDIKVAQAELAMIQGADEIDIVVNIGKVLGGDWRYVEDDIRNVNDVVVKHGGILKVIFENDYLGEEHIIKLCQICSDVGVAFVKTSTGYGFVKQDNGMYSYRGATAQHPKLMREHCKESVQIKAAGGVRTLDDLLHVMSLGVTRIGATATAQMLEDAVARGIVSRNRGAVVCQIPARCPSSSVPSAKGTRRSSHKRPMHLSVTLEASLGHLSTRHRIIHRRSSKVEAQFKKSTYPTSSTQTLDT